MSINAFTETVRAHGRARRDHALAGEGRTMRDPVARSAPARAKARAACDFFQVLRLIENAHPAQPRIGASLRPRDDAVRFGQDPALIFQPGAGPVQPASGRRAPRLAVNFFGLLGPNGPLPLHLTEYVRDRAAQRAATDLGALPRRVPSPHAVRCSTAPGPSAEPAISLDRPDSDRFADYVGSAVRHRRAGACASATPSATSPSCTSPACWPTSAPGLPGLVAILRAYFRLPVAGRTVRRPLDARCRRTTRAAIGRAGAAATGCGDSLGAGPQVWDCQHKFRIVIGPLDYADYEPLPAGRRQPAPPAGLGATATPASTLDWDVRLIAGKTRAGAAAAPGRAPRRALGWTSWLASAAPRRTPDQLLVWSTCIETRTDLTTTEETIMAEISRVALFGKLNSLCYQAIESAPCSASCAAIRTSSWCTGSTRSCSCRIRTCTASSSTSSSIRRALARDLTEALDRLPRGATSISDLSSQRRGGGRARLGLRHADVRRIAGAHRPPDRRHAEDADLRNALYGISRSSSKIKVDDLTEQFRAALLGGSPEASMARPTASSGGGAAPGEASGAIAPARWASRRR